MKRPPAGFKRTGHMGEHVSVHCPQAVSTERQLRKLGQVPEHIRWQVLQLVVPQVEFLVEYSAHSFCGITGNVIQETLTIHMLYLLLHYTLLSLNL